MSATPHAIEAASKLVEDGRVNTLLRLRHSMSTTWRCPAIRIVVGCRGQSLLRGPACAHKRGHGESVFDPATPLRDAINEHNIDTRNAQSVAVHCNEDRHH